MDTNIVKKCQVETEISFIRSICIIFLEILFCMFFFFSESIAGEFTYVHSNPRAHRYNNGTLVLSDIEENDAGSYLCQASNGIGAGLSRIITLDVLGNALMLL